MQLLLLHDIPNCMSHQMYLYASLLPQLQLKAKKHHQRILCRLIHNVTNNYSKPEKHKGQYEDEDDKLICDDYDVVTVTDLTVMGLSKSFDG